MLRTLLVFLAGALIGANLVYYAATHGMVGSSSTTLPTIAEPPPTQAASAAFPAPTTRADTAPAGMPARPAKTSETPAAVTMPATSQAIGPTGLLLPVAGIRAEQLVDTFSDARSEGRVHDAIDIMAPRGTPVLAASDGTVAKLFTSKAGGLTIYEFDPGSTWVYYYAHLDRYAANLAEGQAL